MESTSVLSTVGVLLWSDATPWHRVHQPPLYARQGAVVRPNGLGHLLQAPGPWQLPTASTGVAQLAVDPAQLAMILEGIELSARRGPRYAQRDRGG
jgi:hypothetical protein